MAISSADKQVFSNVLLKAEIPVIDSRQCQQVHKDIKITRHMFCAGYNNKRVDTCLGDSGGPAVYKIAGLFYSVTTRFPVLVY